MTSVLIDQPTRSNEFLNDPDLSFMTQFPECGSRPECGHQVAAKTGTTDKTINGVDYAVDNWTMGYTPDFVVGVWSGNANGAPLGQGAVGVTGAAPIWQDIMSAASGYCDLRPDALGLLPCPNVTPQSLGIQNPQFVFARPDDVHATSLNTYNGLLGGGNTDYVIDGMAPSQAGGNPNPNNNRQNQQNQGQP
jgi:membrane peptidoglycan carboxypeptidase